MHMFLECNRRLSGFLNDNHLHESTLTCNKWKGLISMNIFLRAAFLNSCNYYCKTDVSYNFLLIIVMINN